MPASYKIPQNVQLEDKIFGPFTLKQFLYLLAAGMISFVSFQTLYLRFPPAFWGIVVPTWAVAVMFVFIRPYEQPFSKFMFNFIRFATTPQRRIWHRMPTLQQVKLVDDRQADQIEEVRRPSPDEIRGRLSELAHIVDTRGWSDVDTEGSAAVSNRVVGGESERKLNIEQSAGDEPEDILEQEDEGRGSARSSQQLATMIKQPTTTGGQHG